MLMKIDIELFECRAFLGSPEVLVQSRNITLVAVIMEWVFIREHGKYSEQCRKEKVIELAKLFLDNGFTAFRMKGKSYQLSSLDTTNFGVDWKFDVVWLSNSMISTYLNT